MNTNEEKSEKSSALNPYFTKVHFQNAANFHFLIYFVLVLLSKYGDQSVITNFLFCHFTDFVHKL